MTSHAPVAPAECPVHSQTQASLCHKQHRENGEGAGGLQNITLQLFSLYLSGLVSLICLSRLPSHKRDNLYHKDVSCLRSFAPQH